MFKFITKIFVLLISLVALYVLYWTHTIVNGRLRKVRVNKINSTYHKIFKSISLKTSVPKANKIKKTNDLIVIVLSSREEFEEREVIRNTWASNHDNVFFIVGNYCSIPPLYRKQWTCDPTNKYNNYNKNYIEKEKKLTNKLKMEKNVILVDMIDVYRNLAEKLHLAYKWVYKTYGKKYVLKVDLDTFVRISLVEEFIRNRSVKYECIVGGIQQGKVAKSGKWAEHKYKKLSYPPFPSGSGHIISSNLLEYIVKHDFVYYQGEDTSLGIFFDEANVKVKFTKTNKIITHSGDCFDTNKMVIGHNIKPSKMKKCWSSHCKNKPKGVIGNVFINMINILNKIEAPYNLHGGTLLSYYRDCSVEGSDIDITIELNWFTKNNKKLKQKLMKSGWKNTMKFGTFGKVGYEEAWVKNNIKVDLFSQSIINRKYTQGLTVNGVTYPCTIEKNRTHIHKWGNLLIRVPYPIETALKSLYNDWKTPVKKWVWNVDPFKLNQCTKTFTLGHI